MKNKIFCFSCFDYFNARRPTCMRFCEPRAVSVAAPTVWNSLPDNVVNSDTLATFKKATENSPFSLRHVKRFATERLSICCRGTIQVFIIHSCVVIALGPPHLHLTTSKVMVLVWRLRGNISLLFYILPTCYVFNGKNSSYSPVGPWVFLCFLGCMICLYVGVCFVLPRIVKSCFDACVTNLNEPPSSCLLPPYYCGLGAGCIPFRAIVNKKQCETRGYFCRCIVIHYWIGDVMYKTHRVLPFTIT